MFFASECIKQTPAPCAGDAVNNQSLSKERTVMTTFSGQVKYKFTKTEIQYEKTDPTQ